MNSDIEPWPEPVSTTEVADETRALLRKHTRFNEHELVAATCYILSNMGRRREVSRNGFEFIPNQLSTYFRTSRRSTTGPP